MPEVGILFLIHLLLFLNISSKVGLNARGGHFVFNTRLRLRSQPLIKIRLNARGGHFVFNTQFEDWYDQGNNYCVLMPEVGILFLIPEPCFISIVYNSGS